MTETGVDTPPVTGHVTFFYYKDLAAPERFYGETLGLRKTFDKGWVKFFQLTDQSYVGLIDEAHGHHKVSEHNSVMLSLETPNLEDWYARTMARGATLLSHPDFAGSAEKLITAFLLEDPGGYTVEFFRFNRRN